MTKIEERTDWDQMADEVYALIVRLRQKPEKTAFALGPGQILNAYREGDISFEEAVEIIQKWKDRAENPLPPSPSRSRRGLCPTQRGCGQ